MTFFRVSQEFCTALVLEKGYFDISMCFCSPNNRKSTILSFKSLVFFLLGDRIILTNRTFCNFFQIISKWNNQMKLKVNLDPSILLLRIYFDMQWVYLLICEDYRGHNYFDIFPTLPKHEDLSQKEECKVISVSSFWFWVCWGY